MKTASKKGQSRNQKCKTTYEGQADSSSRNQVSIGDRPIIGRFAEDAPERANKTAIASTARRATAAKRRRQLAAWGRCKRRGAHVGNISCYSCGWTAALYASAVD